MREDEMSSAAAAAPIDPKQSASDATDIVDRLRSVRGATPDGAPARLVVWMREAADEIERTRAAASAMLAALEPFAQVADEYDEWHEGDLLTRGLRLKRHRAARAAILAARSSGIKGM